MEEVQLGQYGIPALLTVILMVVYNYLGTEKIGKRGKPLIAMGLGIILSLIALKYKGLPFTFINVVDYFLYGLLQGAGAVGLYEGQKAVRRVVTKKPEPKPLE
jgi:multisubunit Na+/H+ antiporter MnhB subunit